MTRGEHGRVVNDETRFFAALPDEITAYREGRYIQIRKLPCKGSPFAHPGANLKPYRVTPSWV